MADTPLPHEVLLDRLHDLANRSLELWEVPRDATARLINLSENATYLVEAPKGWRSILRVHREGYHSKTAIGCELAWSTALDHDGCVTTPGVIKGRDGHAIQTAAVDGLPTPRHMVMFQFVDGHQPDESHDLEGPFEELGEIAARTHIHSMAWQRPQPFERLVWDLNAVFGPSPTWGDWRDAPNMTADIKAIVQRVEQVVTNRLNAFGKDRERYGLIHADMRLANLLIDGNDTRLIDFDDCGLGWFLYDFAAAISFMEDHSKVPALKDSWVKGYQRIRDVSTTEVAELDTFVMLRRLALLAWIGSHGEAPEAAAQAPHFADVTAKLGEDYLGRFT